MQRMISKCLGTVRASGMGWCLGLGLGEVVGVVIWVRGVVTVLGEWPHRLWKWLYRLGECTITSTISQHCNRFDQLQSLGKTVISSASSKSSEDSISSRMRQLTTDRASLKESWEKRNKQLKQCSELQLFLRDAEQVDSATSAQEVFLSNDDLGVSSSQPASWIYRY